jgi:hypothetical protein
VLAAAVLLVLLPPLLPPLPLPPPPPLPPSLYILPSAFIEVLTLETRALLLLLPPLPPLPLLPPLLLVDFCSKSECIAGTLALLFILPLLLPLDDGMLLVLSPVLFAELARGRRPLGVCVGWVMNGCAVMRCGVM